MSPRTSRSVSPRTNRSASPRRHRGSLLLWRLRRRPFVWWSLAAVAAGLTALSLHSSLEAASARCPTSPATAAAPSAADPGLAASLPDGTRAVAVPVSGTLALAVGDEVDLVAPALPTVEGIDATGEAGARTVAEAAEVVHVAAEAVTVAVPEAKAADAALAAAQGGTTLVLRGTG